MLRLLLPLFALGAVSTASIPLIIPSDVGGPLCGPVCPPVGLQRYERSCIGWVERELYVDAYTDWCHGIATGERRCYGYYPDTTDFRTMQPMPCDYEPPPVHDPHDRTGETATYEGTVTENWTECSGRTRTYCYLRLQSDDPYETITVYYTHPDGMERCPNLKLAETMKTLKPYDRIRVTGAMTERFVMRTCEGEAGILRNY